MLFTGYFIRRVVTPLAEYNIPAPVIGGLLVAEPSRPRYPSRSTQRSTGRNARTSVPAARHN
jgi:hypothetical protein